MGVGKLNAIRITRAPGYIPQNVDFAISAGTARAFLDAQGVPYETAPPAKQLEPADDVVDWLIGHGYAPDLQTSIVHVLEQTKRVEVGRRRREGDWLRSDRVPPFLPWWPPQPTG